MAPGFLTVSFRNRVGSGVAGDGPDAVSFRLRAGAPRLTGKIDSRHTTQAGFKFNLLRRAGSGLRQEASL